MNRGSHSDLIYNIVKLTGVNSYLELGVYDGDTFSKVSRLPIYSVGVDIKDLRFDKSVGIFLHCSTDEFFSNNKETFDCIFIDACHEFEQVRKDFISAISILNEDGMIFLHDTDPESKNYTDPGYCGDSYKMLEWINKYYPSLEMVTLPINECGITIVRRKDDKRTRKFL